MIELKKVESKHLIFDNTDDYFYGEHSFNIYNGENIQFSTREITQLSKLEGSEPNILKQILNYCTGIHKYDIIPELSQYRSQEDLTAYFKETPKYFTVISLGESQPGRYKIFIEGIFEKCFQ
jgi:hypothetical protein